MLTAEPVARMYRFLPHTDKIIYSYELPPGLPDVVMVSDNGAFHRLGKRVCAPAVRARRGPAGDIQDR